MIELKKPSIAEDQPPPPAPMPPRDVMPAPYAMADEVAPDALSPEGPAEEPLGRGPLLLTAMSGTSLAQLIDDIALGFPAKSQPITIVLNEPSVALVHRVQVEMTALAAALVALRGGLDSEGAHATTFKLEGWTVLARACRATPEEIDAQLGDGSFGPCFRISSEDGETLVWCVDPLPPDPANPADRRKLPEAWPIFKMFRAAELVSFVEPPTGLKLPLQADHVKGRIVPADVRAWIPRVAGGLAKALREADVPPLDKLPMSWVAIEWVGAIAAEKYGSGAVPLVTSVFAIAQIVAHLERANTYNAWLGLDSAWSALGAIAKQYVARNDVCTGGFDRVPAARLAFDSLSKQLVSTGPHYRLAAWPMMEPEKPLLALVRSQCSPSIDVRNVTTGRGKSATTAIKLVPLLPAETSAIRVKHDPEVRRLLGIPEIDVKAYPVAYQSSGFTALDTQYGMPTIRVRIVPAPAKAEHLSPEQELALRDPVGFVVRLFRRLQTPFRTEQDARRFCMALAAPLLREVCAGRLPAFLFEGASGSGKGLSKEALFRMWNRAASSAAPTQCYLGVEGTNTHEQNLTFAEMGTRIYLSFTEIAKAGTSDVLVRQTERETVTARAHKAAPEEVPNRYVVIADAVEGLPDRKEIARRTERVRMRHVRTLDVVEGSTAVSFKPTTFIRAMEDVGPMLIEGLRRKLEALGPEHIMTQSDDSGRSAASNALAQLCQVDRDAVGGGALEELWAMMADIVVGVPVPHPTLGTRKVHATSKPASGNDGQLPRKFGKYSFREVMKLAEHVPEHTELYRNMRGNGIKTQIDTEFAGLFVTLNAGKCRVLVVFAKEAWWVYAPLGDAFVFEPLERVMTWAANAIGPAAVAALASAREMARTRFRVRSSEAIALEALTDAIVPLTQYAMPSAAQTRAALDAIEGVFCELRGLALPPDVEVALVNRIVQLADIGLLQGELDLLERQSPAHVQAAGLHENPWAVSSQALADLVRDPRWIAFRKFRALHSIFPIAPSIVINLGIEAGLLSGDWDWTRWGPSEKHPKLDHAAAVIAALADTPFLVEFDEDFSDATHEDIATYAEQWSTDWVVAA